MMKSLFIGVAVMTTLVATAVAQSITEYGPTAGYPGTITAGPDGNLWFTEDSVGGIGKITPSGVITEYGPTASNPIGITAGPDGNVWFTDNNAMMIGRITTAGVITEYGPT